MEKIKSLFKYYFKPNSVVWLTGVASITLGVVLGIKPDHYVVNIVGEVFAGLQGTQANPAQLILTGLMAFGIGARKGE